MNGSEGGFRVFFWFLPVFGCVFCLLWGLAGCVGWNPVVQAEALNSEKLDLHIIVGLCIGHDIQFNMHSRAPTTTLIVKDRVTGHNPVISLYSAYHHPRYWDEE